MCVEGQPHICGLHQSSCLTGSRNAFILTSAIQASMGIGCASANSKSSIIEGCAECPSEIFSRHVSSYCSLLSRCCHYRLFLKITGKLRHKTAKLRRKMRKLRQKAQSLKGPWFHRTPPCLWSDLTTANSTCSPSTATRPGRNRSRQAHACALLLSKAIKPTPDSRQRLSH